MVGCVLYVFNAPLSLSVPAVRSSILESRGQQEYKDRKKKN